MTQRITTQMVDNSTIEAIDTDLSQLDRTQNELETGFRINQASDDPYGAAESLSLNAAISSYKSYSQNISTANSQTETASSALQSIESVVQAIRNMVVEGANGTSNSNDLEDEATQVYQYIEQIKSDANAQYDGSYIFAGTATGTQPYQTANDSDSTASSPTVNDTYQGNDGTISTVISAGTTLTTSVNLHGVLGDGTGSAGAYNSSTGSGGLLTTLRKIYTDMESGSTTALSSDLTSLDASNSQLEQLQAQVGTTTSRLGMASTFITNVSAAANTQLGDVEDVDEASATIEFSTQETAYEAALKSSADIIQESLLNFLNS